MRRRAFLKVLAGGSAVVAGGGLLFHFGVRVPHASRLFTPEEAAWLAALAPVDAPLAEVERRLDAERIEFYRAGLEHLRRLRPGFPKEAPVEQARYVKTLIESDEFAFQFLTQVAQDASEVHYGSDRTWAAIGYSGPPQFRGYPEFQDPP